MRIWDGKTWNGQPAGKYPLWDLQPGESFIDQEASLDLIRHTVNFNGGIPGKTFHVEQAGNGVIVERVS